MHVIQIDRDLDDTMIKKFLNNSYYSQLLV